MDRLSRDVVGIVLTFLDARDVISFCCVCKRWNELALQAHFTVPMLYVNPRSWRRLMSQLSRWKMRFRGLCLNPHLRTWQLNSTRKDFERVKADTEALFETILRFSGDHEAWRRFHRLRELHISGSTRAEQALEMGMPLFDQLQVLSLPGVYGSYGLGSEIDRKLRTLRHLNVCFQTGMEHFHFTLPKLEECVGVCLACLDRLPNPELLRVVISPVHEVVRDNLLKLFPSLELIGFSSSIISGELSFLKSLKQIWSFGQVGVPAYMMAPDYFRDTRSLQILSPPEQRNAGFPEGVLEFVPLQPVTCKTPHTFFVAPENANWLRLALENCSSQLQHMTVCEAKQFTYSKIGFENLVRLECCDRPSAVQISASGVLFPSLKTFRVTNAGVLNYPRGLEFNKEKMPKLESMTLVTGFKIAKSDFDPFRTLMREEFTLILTKDTRLSEFGDWFWSFYRFRKFRCIGCVDVNVAPTGLTVHHDTPDDAEFLFQSKADAEPEKVTWIRRKL